MTFIQHDISKIFQRVSKRWVAGVICLALLTLGWTGGGLLHASSLIYKNYIVRYDRGWDILCEPYVVQKNDWVLKIFRQKGEIAHTDFREFLGIFQRLNPQVKDINMIRPGQAIDIPLRKLEHGTLTGQSTGVVTIPFVSLTEVADLLHRNSQQYTIQRGDTVSQLVARYFGRFGSRSYQEGVKLFQAANPQIGNLDVIYAGQKIYLPDPGIREKEWYDAMYDAQGNLRKTLGGTSQTAPANTAAGETGQAGSAGLPAPAVEPAEPASPLEAAAATVGGKLSEKGTYYIPQPGGSDFEVDLSRHPMLTLPNARMLFTRDGRVMGRDPADLEKSWPEGKIVTYDDQASVEDIVADIFDALGKDQSARTEVGFSHAGVQVAVHAKWIKPQADQRWLCITPVASPDELTPDSMRRYLEQNGIELKELLPGGQGAAAAGGSDRQRHLVKNILDIIPTSQKDFTRRLCRALDFTFAPDVSVTFPYAGVQIKASATLIATPDHREVLVDFGELYGDALKSIRQTGQRVVQIATEDSYGVIVRKLMQGLDEHYTENPTFLAARRSSQENTTVTIQGILFTDARDQRTLLTAAELHSAVSDLLSAENVAVVTW